MKIRRYITEAAAKAMYTHMILPLFDNNGLLLIACTLDKKKRDLQKRQNNVICTCSMYLCYERISIVRFHSEMKLISLEQR